MTSYREAEIGNENFIADIFYKTYGIHNKALYLKPDILEKARSAVVALRSSYKPNRNADCDCRYDDENCRNAYMFAYYPYYVDPAYNVVKEFVAPNLKNREVIYMDYFACGSCPELYATVNAFAKNRGGVVIIMFAPMTARKIGLNT